MSYMTELLMNKQIKEAAISLDVLQAAQAHKLEGDSKKHALLAKVMRDHSERFQRLAKQQTVFSADEFFKKAFEVVRQMRADAAVIAKSRREKRERDAAERANVLNMLGATA